MFSSISKWGSDKDMVLQKTNAGYIMKTSCEQRENLKENGKANIYLGMSKGNVYLQSERGGWIQSAGANA